MKSKIYLGTPHHTLDVIYRRYQTANEIRGALPCTLRMLGQRKSMRVFLPVVDLVVLSLSTHF